MTTYICKCGRRVKKSTDASTTGNRLSGYAPSHECWGCPYAMPYGDFQWDESARTVSRETRGYECRMSKTLTYAQRPRHRPNQRSLRSQRPLMSLPRCRPAFPAGRCIPAKTWPTMLPAPLRRQRLPGQPQAPRKQMPSSTMMRMTCRFNHTRKEFRPWALTHPVALLPFPAV